ncbi:hypothetical protein MCEMIH15_01208 [Caulobacteraceae bacterium]
MPTKQKTVRIVGTMALLCVAASSAHCKDAPFAQGVIFRTCAPYDGAALEAHIPTVSGNQVVVIQVNEYLGAESFSRPIAPRTRPGGASVHLCKKAAADPKYPLMPQFSWDSCVEAASGSVEIDGLIGSATAGQLDVTYADRKRTGAFIGSAMAGQLDVTFANGKRINADFSARFWDPEGKFDWGCRGFGR